MTEAEAKLIEAVLCQHELDLMEMGLSEHVALVLAERSRHPYGSIAESMMAEPRKPEPYGSLKQWADMEMDRTERKLGLRRDICDPAPMQVSTSSISRTTLTDRYDVREPRSDAPREPPGSPDAWRG